MKRMIFWTLGALLLVIIIGGVGVQYAISRNGPAVLNTVDRMTGGDGGAELKAGIATGDHAQQKLIVWGPASRDPADPPLPVLVFFHGGSWQSGDPADYGFIGRAFVERGFIVVLGGYRLGEAGRYPAMLEDTARVIGWTKREIAQYGGDPEKIVISGHSAGAYNVVMAALEEQWLGREGLSGTDIKGVVGLSGPYDFFPFDSDSTKAAFGDAPDGAATQPLAHIRGDGPPMLLVHGEKDTLVYPRNTRILAEKINQAGGSALTVFNPEMDHNRPLISLAAPWRSNSEMAGLIAGFASAAAEGDTLSVPVKPD